MITILPYQPTWPADFTALAVPIRSALGSLATRIDHIGSTSVPGLDAKDIIDIQLSLRSFDHIQPVQSALEELGYSMRLDFSTDHFPPGYQGPPSEWEKRYFDPPPEQRPTHLHVRVEDRLNQRYALLFRDYLRQHPAVSAGYAMLKRTLAYYHGGSYDHTPYVEIKDPVCDIIMAAAEEWAVRTAWQPGPSDA